MLKRATQKALVRLRAFLQAEIILEIRLLRGELRQLGIEHQGLRATLDQQLAMLDRLHGEQGALAATLERVALLDQTARSVEDGLLSLTLLRKQEAEAAEGLQS
jgi:hypothetical protein